jgi:pyruvate/2-oxoglutarate dehydrogenase complex dihydrolipoamide dehydrogenase (E3) component
MERWIKPTHWAGRLGDFRYSVAFAPQKMKLMKSYDILIVGAGQAGIPLARKLSDAGRRVAIAERKHLGGSCVNFGCTPTKAVIASARVAHLARRAGEFGISLPSPIIDFPKVLARARAIVEQSKAGLEKGLGECSADVLRGQARFTGRDAQAFTLTVDAQPVRATQVILNVGRVWRAFLASMA